MTTMYFEIGKNIKELNEKQERLIRDEEASKNSVERFQKIYDGLIAQNQKNKKIITYIKYAELIHEWIYHKYIENEIVIREKLEESVNAFFSKMYHGKRRVEIDDKYRIKLLTDSINGEIVTDNSEGLETVKNFSFIAGIVDLARQRIIDKSSMNDEGIDLSSEPYPLIMDAPFSKADEMHVKNISKVLPTVAEQVLMFVMKKDFSHAEDDMSRYIGKRYYLEKKSETLTYIKEC